MEQIQSQSPNAEIQESLNIILNDHPQELKIDGQFGEETEEEVFKLQERLQIDKDGVVTEVIASKLEGLANKLIFINDMKIDKLKD